MIDVSPAGWLPLKGGTMTGAIFSTQANATDLALRTQVSGDSGDRFKLSEDGTITWGDGAGLFDITMARSGAATLLVDGTVETSGKVIVDTGGSSAAPSIQIGSTVGWFRPASNTIGVVASLGAETARFKATGFAVQSTGAAGTVEKFRVVTPATVDNAATSILTAGAAADKALVVQMQAAASAAPFVVQNSAGSAIFTMGTAGNFVMLDAATIAFGTTTGTKIGTATSQKLSFWNKTPIIQPTTGITAAAFVANTSGIVNDTATFGGYTIGKIAAALINVGILT